MDYFAAFIDKVVQRTSLILDPSSMLAWTPLCVLLSVALAWWYPKNRCSAVSASFRYLDAFCFCAAWLGIFSLLVRPLGLPIDAAVSLLKQRSLYYGSQSLRDFPLPAVVLIYLLLLDLAGYWHHRLCHAFSPLWEIHKLHHSATSFNVIAAFREHPLNDVIAKVTIALPMVLVFGGLKLEGGLLIVYLCGVKVLNLLQHSRLISDFGIFGRVLVSPAHHLVHHSTDPTHFNMNFGQTFIFWDMIFGTYCNPPSSADKTIVIGLNDKRYEGIVSSLFLPCLESTLESRRLLILILRRLSSVAKWR